MRKHTARTRALATRLDPTAPEIPVARAPYTFVCAESMPQAERWRRSNGVATRGLRVITPRGLNGARGTRLTDGDRVVVLVEEPKWESPAWRSVRAALIPCGLGLTIQPEFI